MSLISLRRNIAKNMPWKVFQREPSFYTSTQELRFAISVVAIEYVELIARFLVHQDISLALAWMPLLAVALYASWLTKRTKERNMIIPLFYVDELGANPIQDPILIVALHMGIFFFASLMIAVSWRFVNTLLWHLCEQGYQRGLTRWMNLCIITLSGFRVYWVSESPKHINRYEMPWIRSVNTLIFIWHLNSRSEFNHRSLERWTDESNKDPLEG